MGEPSSLGNSGWGGSIGGFCGGGIGGHGGEKMGLSLGGQLKVGPSMGNCSSIPLFGLLCCSSVIMLIFDGAFKG